jgi:glycerol-3-phosphate acyltransferase PlsY
MNLIIFYKILFVILTYLFGSFPTAFVLYRLKTGEDIRKVGSGNVGGTNVTRTMGATTGVLTILIDMLKGFLPILVLYFIFPDDLILLAIVAVVTVIGHIYPVYLKFKGGKGISTTYGVVLGLSCLPFADDISLWLRIIPAIAILGTWLVVFAISRIVSLASLLASTVMPLSFYFSKHPMPVVIATICIFAIIFFAHRDNIKRLIRKEEKRLKGRGA